MLVGLYATLKVGSYGVKTVMNKLKENSSLSDKQFLEKYGEGSWAVIADVNGCENFCIFLAKKGINLILLGNEEDE